MSEWKEAIRIIAQHGDYIGLPASLHAYAIAWLREELVGRSLIGSGSCGVDSDTDIETVIGWFSERRGNVTGLPVTIEKVVLKNGQVKYRAFWQESCAEVRIK